VGNKFNRYFATTGLAPTTFSKAKTHAIFGILRGGLSTCKAPQTRREQGGNGTVWGKVRRKSDRITEMSCTSELMALTTSSMPC